MVLNDASVQAVNAARWGQQFGRPLYDSYCFTQLPLLIPSLFSNSAGKASDLLLGPLTASYIVKLLGANRCC